MKRSPARLSDRLRGWFWDLSPRFLPLLRQLKRELALVRYRFRARSGKLPPRVVAGRRVPGHPLGHPAIALEVPKESDLGLLERFTTSQTETSVTTDPDEALGASFCLTALPPAEALPPTWLESQLFAAVAENLLSTAAGWATPSLRRFEPASQLHLPEGAPAVGLLRLPSAEVRASPPVLGRAVPHITAEERLSQAELRPCDPPAETRSGGPYFLRRDARFGTVIRQPITPLHEALAALPEIPGPPTVLFLQPYLAVGGAERLLFDLLDGLAGRYRLLVVTLEPHRVELGQTVDDARAKTPHVYTLGDWLPREAHTDALLHLVRRYRVETLVSWNGTVLFYEIAAELKRRFSKLRLVNQLFNHEGGWIEHYGPRLVASVDLHLAVNRQIGRALQKRKGVGEEKLAVIHHGVRLPEELPEATLAERRRQARETFGLRADAVVVGAFLRLHPQKRPLDILLLARELLERGEDDFHFLMVGGGPLDAEIDRELAVRPLRNLTRLPLRRDIDRLYDATDLCLLTSSYEGLPIFLLDACARRIPCVATPVGDIPYLFKGGGGVLVDRVGDIAALADAVLSLRSRESRRREGELGRRAVAERFSLERYVQAYEHAIFPTGRKGAS